MATMLGDHGRRFKMPRPDAYLAPATRRLYWKGQVDVGVEVIDIAKSAEVPAAVPGQCDPSA